MQAAGSGEQAVVQRVTWTGGGTPTGEDSVFQFLAQPDSAKTYTFTVDQTYSDGSIVIWSGSNAPARRMESSLGGGGSSTLGIVGVVLGVAALVIAGIALLGREGKRPLA